MRRMVREAAFRLARSDILKFIEDHEQDLHQIFREELENLDEQMPEEEIFTIEKKEIDLPAYAPIHDSAVCSVCGESVMETKARLRGGEAVCIDCAGAERYVLDGSGMSVR